MTDAAAQDRCRPTTIFRDRPASCRRGARSTSTAGSTAARPSCAAASASTCSSSARRCGRRATTSTARSGSSRPSPTRATRRAARAGAIRRRVGPFAVLPEIGGGWRRDGGGGIPRSVRPSGGRAPRGHELLVRRSRTTRERFGEASGSRADASSGRRPQCSDGASERRPRRNRRRGLRRRRPRPTSASRPPGRRNDRLLLGGGRGLRGPAVVPDDRPRHLRHAGRRRRRASGWRRCCSAAASSSCATGSRSWRSSSPTS